MQTRKDNEKKKSSKLVSPYNVREVVLDDAFTTDERNLYYWLMKDKGIEL